VYGLNTSKYFLKPADMLVMKELGYEHTTRHHVAYYQAMPIKVA
jgi:hypothetical protein